jgi:rhamnosyl/mannosyltransferase
VDGLQNQHDIENVDILCLQNTGSVNSARSDLVNDVIVTRAATWNMFGFNFSCDFFLEFREKSRRADVIHLHFPFIGGALALLRLNRRKFKGKIVISYHADFPNDTFFGFFATQIVRKCLEKASAIVVADERVIKKSALLRDFKDKCKVLPVVSVDVNAVEEIVEEPLEKPILRTIFPHNRKILYCGRLNFRNNLDVLIENFRKITGAELFICGEFEPEIDLKKEILHSGNITKDNKIHYLGNLEVENLLNACKECDFMVYTPCNIYGYPQLLGAVFGKPIVSLKRLPNNGKTAVNAGVNVFNENGVTGYVAGNLQEFAIFMQKFTDDDELTRLMGINAYKSVRKAFRRADLIEGIYKLYNGL